GIGSQWVHGRENSQLGNGALENDGGVEVRKRRGRRRVGEVIRGHIDRLKRGDGAFLGRGDTFLKVTHFRGQRRLVTDSAGSAAQQRRNLRTGLGESEDVVNEEQYVLVLFVAE